MFAVGFTMLATLCALSITNSMLTVTLLCAFCAVGLFVSLLCIHKLQTAFLPTVFLSAAAVCLLFALYSSFYYLPALTCTAEDTEVNAQISDYPYYSDGRYYCFAKLKDKSGKKYNIRLSFSRYYTAKEENLEKIISLEPGDEVKFQGTVYEIAKDYEGTKRYYNSRRIFLGAYPTDALTVESPKHRGVLYYLKRERKKAENQLLQAFEKDDAALAVSMLTGNKKYLSDRLYRLFSRSGASHIMAVSGVHLSVWIMFVTSIIEKAGLNKKRWAIFLLAFDFLIMFFASFSGSVMRAGFMCMLFLFGTLINKNTDSLNSLGFAATVCILINPFIVMNIGFLLSVCASFSIIAVSAPLCDRLHAKTRKRIPISLLRRLINGAADIAVISFFVFVFTLPVCVYAFEEISVMLIITNLLVVPVAPLMLILFGCFVMFGFIPFVSDVLSFFAGAVSKYIIRCVSVFGSFPFSAISLDEKGEAAVYAVYALAIFVSVVLLALRRRKNKIKS